MYRMIIYSILVLLLPCSLGSVDRGITVRARTSDGGTLELYSNSYALVIGVGAYTQGWDRLRKPVRDAREVGKALERYGFRVTYVDDPDSETLKDALNKFAYGEAGRNENGRAVVFFAGHGHTERTASGDRGFILPTDTPRPGADRVAFMSKAVSMDFIQEIAKGMLCKHVLFLFDSCFSGTLLRGEAHPEPITRKTAKKVRQFITSGSADEQVPDDSQFKVGLLNALEGDADKTRDGYVTGEELGLYLKGRVMEYSNGAQTPQYGKIKDPNLDQGDIVFELPSSPSPAPVPAPPPPAPVAFGHLQVNVNASGSRVMVDGTYRGEASPREPLNLQDVGLGNVEVKVKASGYESVTKRVALKSNEWVQVVIELPVIPPPAPAPFRPEPSRPSVTTSRKAGETITVNLPGGARMEMVWIPPGTFVMGSPQKEINQLNAQHLTMVYSDEGPQHRVTISEGFYLGKYELTQGQWESVMGTRPWSGEKYVQESSDHPAVYISWNDVQEFIGKLNRAEGSEVYRLPTEAEWEYACRAGTATRLSFGDDESQLGEYAWYAGNTWGVGEKYAHGVGSKLPNPWGLYDMHGNVYEWCEDWYGSYSSSSQTDPTGLSTGASRVSRGSAFSSIARSVRSASRGIDSPGLRIYNLGARLLRQGR